MARTEEAKVKIKIDKWLKENLIGADIYKPAGGMFGRAGTADYYITYKSVPIKIEVKKPEGELTKLQLHRLMAHKKAGGISAALIGFEVNKLMLIKQMCEERYEAVKHIIEKL